MSVRAKLMLGTLALMALLGITSAGVAGYRLSIDFGEELQKRGVGIATGIAADSVDDVLAQNPINLQMRFNHHVQLGDGVLYVFALDPGGDVLAHTFEGGFPVDLALANPIGQSAKSKVQALDSRGQRILDVAVPILDGEAGEIHVGLSEEPVQTGVNNIFELLAAVTLGALLIGGIIAVSFATVLTRPLLALRDAAVAVGEGDLDRTVKVDTQDEIGQLATVFNTMIKERKRVEQERENLIKELRSALAEVKRLSGMLPICASCKKVRDDRGYWNQIEVYISERTEASFTHGLCPDCAADLLASAGIEE